MASERSRPARIFQNGHIFVYIHNMITVRVAKSMKRVIALGAFVWLAVASLPHVASATELLAVMRDNCPYCRAWEIQVGSIYNKTDESRVAPLHRIAIDELGRTHYIFNEPVRYTPTFVVMDRGVEIGRIVGYSDEAMFWGLLREILDRMEPRVREMAAEAR